MCKNASSFLLCCLMTAGCVTDAGEMFRVNDPIDVKVTIDPVSWDQLRFSDPGLEHYTDPACPNGPRPRPFDWYPASVKVNGVNFSGIEVRKKGFLGSMNPSKPSLKIRFRDDDHPGDSRHLTLNNNNQDVSHTRQCLAYHLFEKAGLVAPRCGLARVTVNGEELGIYTNVEPIKRSLLQDQFGDSSGDLYEITFADFEPEILMIFDAKYPEQTTDRSPLAQLAQALEADDESLFAELGAILDLDDYFTFWAMEVITAHSDGYHGNRNNSYIYLNPVSGKFHFIPWGTDTTFGYPTDIWAPFLGGPALMPWSVYAHGAIGRRILESAEGRQRYEETVRTLLDEVWDPAELGSMVNTLVTGAAPHLSRRLVNRARDEALWIKDYIHVHKGRLLAELDAGLTAWQLPTLKALCGEVAHTFSGNIRTDFGTTLEDIFYVGKGTIVENSGGQDTDMPEVKGTAHRELHSSDAPMIVLHAAFGPAANGMLALLAVVVPEESFVPGATVPLDFGVARAEMAWVDPVTYAMVSAGYVLLGEMIFDDASTTDGQPVGYSFTAPVFVPVP